MKSENEEEPRGPKLKSGVSSLRLQAKRSWRPREPLTVPLRST